MNGFDSNPSDGDVNFMAFVAIPYNKTLLVSIASASMAPAEDISRIQTFLRHLHEDLSFIVETREEFLPGYDEQLYGQIQAAWEDGRGEVDRLATGIGDADDDTLRRHGLVGPQLELKLRAIYDRREGFEFVKEHWSEINGFPAPIRLKVAKPITVSYLNIIEEFIDSIAGAVPGAGSALEELKSIIKQLIPFL